MLRIVSFFCSALFTFNIFAVNQTPWQRLTIPNAKCGNGEDYNLFIRKGNPKKIAIAFEEGGVCWSYGTCLGFLSRTNLKPVESFNMNEAVFSANSQLSSVNDFTFVFFPYCTGDVYMGKHVADYKGKKVLHQGKFTVEKSISYLVDQKHLGLKTADQVVLTGFSAGAIGSIFHISTVENYLPTYTKRSVIADSPGLHFGPSFWKKFTPAQIKDFDEVFNTIGVGFDPNDGLVAKRIPGYCNKYSHWNIGVIQSTHDFVMSFVFGNISPSSHFDLIKSEEGLENITTPISNCSSWIPSSRKHMFLNSESGSTFLAGGKTALSYFNDVVNADPVYNKLPNYKGFSLWNYMFYQTHNQ